MSFVSTYFKEVQETILTLPVQEVDDVVNVLLAAQERGSTIFLCGNGGSAATASHMACDLAKNITVPGMQQFRVVALTDNIPLMTAWANDNGYENIFAEQLKPLVQPGDILIAISTSGNSPNVLKAVAAAGEFGAISVGFTDQIGGQLKEIVDYCVHVPCTNIEQVEDVHMVLAHCIVSTMRQKLQQRQSATPVAFESLTTIRVSSTEVISV